MRIVTSLSHWRPILRSSKTVGYVPASPSPPPRHPYSPAASAAAISRAAAMLSAIEPDTRRDMATATASTSASV